MYVGAALPPLTKVEGVANLAQEGDHGYVSCVRMSVVHRAPSDDAVHSFQAQGLGGWTLRKVVTYMCGMLEPRATPDKE